MSPPRPLCSQALTATVLVLAIGCAPDCPPVGSTNYDDLVELFGEWRDFDQGELGPVAPDSGAITHQLVLQQKKN